MSFFSESLFIDILSTVVVIILSLYYFSIKSFSHWEKLGIKYVKPVPLFGNSYSTITRKKCLSENQQEIYNAFPEEKYVGMFLFRIPILMLRDPHLIHHVLSKDFAHFYDRGITVDKRLDLLSLHLVNLRGQEWKYLRSKLTPAFSSGKLKIMCSQLEDCANVLFEQLENIVGVDSSNVQELMAKFATDVIGSCAFGLQFNSLKDPESEFRRKGREIFKPSMRFILKLIARSFHPSLPYYLGLKTLSSDVEEFFLNFVKDAVHQREESQIERKDFIQILIELKKEDSSNGINPKSNEKPLVLDDQVLASNVFAFFLAGFETMSTTMSFLLFELAANQNIQDTLRSEIVQNLEKNEGELKYETMKELPYTEMVISETMRKYPVGTVLLRECTQTYQVPDSSLVIEKGTRILVPVFSLHHDPQYFPDPEKFDPERFSLENKPKIVQGTYLPFGDGPRICIGLQFSMIEMKFALCKIMPKFEFTLSNRTAYPIRFKKGVPLLGPEDGVWLNISRR
uniref:Cytochrome P450 n=1 Tax=Graphocephala atropunctata TaxID=36148 RepID=A0A1B6L6W5_9HEMI